MDLKKAQKYIYWFEDNGVEYLFRRPLFTEEQKIHRRYSKEFSDAIREGILPRTMLEKQTKNEGGVLSDKESEEFKKLREEIADLEQERAKAEKAKDKEKVTEIEKEIEKKTPVINYFQAIEKNTYRQSADQIAENATVLYVLVNFWVKKEGEEIVDVFPGDSLEDKYNKYGEMLHGDELQEVLDRMSAHCYFFYIGAGKKFEQFKEFDEKLKGDLAEQTSEEIEETSGEDASVEKDLSVEGTAQTPEKV